MKNATQCIDWLTSLIIKYKKENDWKADDNTYFGEIIGKLHLLERIKKEVKDE